MSAETPVKKLRRKTEEHEGRGRDWGRPLSRKSGQEAGPRYGLADVRIALGKTQMQVADRARMTQGDVSVFENRQDVKVSTLARYAQALGGRVEAFIIVGDQRYVLDLPR